MPSNKNTRIENIDFIRGVAVLGILVMNSLIFALPVSAYFNHSSEGATNIIDWIIIFFQEIFISQKMMGLFSLLFGASFVLFLESLRIKGYKKPKLIILWRNFILFLVGVIHAYFWMGDILTIYAILSIILLFLHNRNILLLLFLAVFFTYFSSILALIFQSFFDSEGNLSKTIIEQSIFTDKIGLGKFWFSDSSILGEAMGLYFLVDIACRSLGMMLLGICLYRLNFLSAEFEKKTYINKLIIPGFIVGIILSLISLVWYQIEDYSPEIALIANIPNKIGIIPLVVSYVGLCSLLYKKISNKYSSYFVSTGRMAFTNYLSQTILCFIIFNLLFSSNNFSRKEIIIFVFIIWIIQLIWSKYWMSRFNQGPLEFIWRKITYLGKN